MKKPMKKLSLIFIFLLFLLAKPHAVFAAANEGFTFTYGQQKISVSQETVNSWQSPQTIEKENIFVAAPEPIQTSILKFLGQTQPQPNFSKTYNYNLSAVYGYINGLAKTVNLPAIDPVLKIQNNRVTELTPPQTGEETDVYKSAFDAIATLEAGQTQLELSVIQTDPKEQLADTNSLGIAELIAQGVSNFAGSPKNRRHNITVGVEKFKGLIIPKGATFSFDNNLGPVEAEAGFLPELVIKKEGTVPEFGGGLCQVSTTTFRAAMAAGVPITQRKNHAYAVQYYSPQGTDATIYPGSADLKFINDTPGAILIWPYEKDANTLVFDFYGTDDGRKVTLEKPDVYDKLPDGSMKATWTREVVGADGKPRTDVFSSVYQSPALFHKTESFVSSTGEKLTPTLAPPIKTN